MHSYDSRITDVRRVAKSSSQPPVGDCVQQETHKCGALVESYGHHEFSCIKAVERQQPHGVINYMVWLVFTSHLLQAHVSCPSESKLPVCLLYHVLNQSGAVA